MTNQKILVWDGIFRGYKYITEEEQKDRIAIQETMQNKMWSLFYWAIYFAMGIIIIFGILMFILSNWI